MSRLSQTHPISDSGLTISLHPLILLTISDYITRHTLRHQPRPIVGALLGQQSGHSLTLEHAFECETIEGQSPFATGEVQAQSYHHGSDRQQILLHEAWFKDRLQQYKDVHKAPALELVGWFTTTPVTGPEAAQLPIHQQLLENYNETAVLLAFHPMSVLEGAGVGGGKLPLTIYESVYESAEGEHAGTGAGSGAEAGAMEVDAEGGKEGAGATTEPGLELRFRELPYSVETGETEMIGVDFVARGGGNATAVDAGEAKTKGKEAQNGKAADTRGAKESKAVDEYLSAEDEELIASLTARVNAVKMLHTRITLLKSYLNSLPPSYLTSNTTTTTTTTTTTPTTTATKSPPSQQQESEEQGPNHPLLRSISALLSRLSLLQPSTPTALASFTSETLAEKSDVELVSLLGALGRSIKDARELGRKFGVVENAKLAARKNASVGGLGGGEGMFGGPDEMNLRGGEGDGRLLGFGGDVWGSRGGGGGGEGVWGNGFAG